MREIKFRAWNVATKTMIDLKKMTPLALNMDTDGLFIPFSDGLIIEQFTGLTDKAGREIYEGDIVEHIPADGWNWWNGIVTWQSNGSICWCVVPLPEDRHRGQYGMNSSYQFKVIGNIHENPKLLEAK